MERPGEASKARYLERIKELDLEDLVCRQELAEVLGLKNVSHEDLSRHHSVDWLKAHEAHFSRARKLETADLTGIPQKSIMGPVNYRPIKRLGSRNLIVEPHKHRTGIARIRVAIPAQLRMVEKFLGPKSMGMPDTGYLCDFRAGKNLGSVRSIRSRSSESNHRGRIGFRGDVAEVILARKPSVPAAWSGTEPDADQNRRRRASQSCCYSRG